MEFFGTPRGLLLRGFGCVALLCLTVSAEAAATRSGTAKKAVSPWERASATREAFETAHTASRAEYTRVMDDFRVVYHDNPADTHAPDAVNAVAELLAEEGHELGDQKLSRAAIGQWEFLRTQYPGSHLRVSALLAEAQVAAEIGDATEAREKYALVVKESPRSKEGADARAALAELGRPARTADPRVMPVRSAPLLKPAPAVQPEAAVEPAAVAETPLAAVEPPSLKPASSAVRRGPLAQVTGIRHWSTPTYTRVAIDLGDEVTFEAARVPNPDRIYFDLHGARLGAELVGKSFDVTDDGFLKKIRAAQAGGDVTRVVLDVSDVSEYSAFLLPNPYRLIIDIHGGRKSAVPVVKTELASSSVPVEASAVRRATVAANSSGLPAMAVTDGGETVRPVVTAPATVQPHDNLASGSLIMRHPVAAPRTGMVTRPTEAKPVPNTVTVKAPATATEVAAVSTLPGKVEATVAPTSKPVAAVVKPVLVASNTRVPEARHGAPAPVAVSGAPARAADKTADGETSLVRALGLKIGRIVIDAGHGGHDSGTLGVDGIQEKDVVLDVALRLGKLLHERLGAEIIYTRSDDTFIPLETRTAIANKAQADLFLSIHANSSQDATARGVETYYLNFTSDNAALDVAARENAVGGQSIHQLSDLVKKITLKDKIAESREFAADVEGSLYAGLEKGNAGLKNRGVKKAPFVVLIGANMPSILAEISFVTNPRDAEQLREPEYRQRVAESLFNGVAKYEGGLAGARPVPMVRASTK